MGCAGCFNPETHARDGDEVGVGEPARRIGRGLRGSSNKTVHLFTDRYTVDDLDAVPDAEVIVPTVG